MITYNGYRAGESRTRTFKPKKADHGHTIVKRTTTWTGMGFQFNYKITCECGKTFGSRQSAERTHYAHARHLRVMEKKAEESSWGDYDLPEMAVIDRMKATLTADYGWESGDFEDMTFLDIEAEFLAVEDDFR